MDTVYKGNVALIIVNGQYAGYSKLQYPHGLTNLKYPEEDGKMMKHMLDHSKFDQVKVVKNSENILSDIEHFVVQMRGGGRWSRFGEFSFPLLW